MSVEQMRGRRLRILTWHVHGNYMYYLSQVPHDFHLVVRPGHPAGYAGRVGDLPWPDNVHEVMESDLSTREFDCVLYQSRKHYEEDRLKVFDDRLRALPAICLEHDPPQEHPTNTRHWVTDPHILIVHVTPFNALMWDNGDNPVRIIEHGVVVPGDVRYQGNRARGIVVVNNMKKRGRRLGADVFTELRERVPLDLVGMDAKSMDGLGEIPNTRLAAFCSEYRFFFNPIRYTSLGLAVVEAMMIGMPVVGLATTEMVTVIRNRENGFVHTRLDKLEDVMRGLIADPGLAMAWGEQARRDALRRFNIDRFVSDWMSVLAEFVS